MSTLHPSDKEACETIDAAMFSGDPAEWREKWEEFNRYVERWRKRLDESRKDSEWDFAPGKRVELHPGTDAWMRGDRFGEVKKIDKAGVVHVKMDRSRKTLKLQPSNILKVV